MTEYDLGKVVGDDGEAGNGIASITKTGTSGLVDTYTITYDDGTTTTFTVTNGSNASVTIQTSWGSTTSDSKVPSEKLTKDTLDTKIAKSSTTGLVKNDGTIMTSGTGSTNYSAGNHTHSSYVSGSKVTSWSSTVSDSNIPSEKLVKNSLDDKISKSSTSGLVKNDGTIDTNSYLTSSSASSTYQPLLVSGTNIKTVNNNSLLGSGNITIESGSNVDIVTNWEQTLSDAKVPSEKLTKDSLDTKVDKVTGKGLSTNDFTNSYKNTIDGLSTVATTGDYDDLSNKPSIPSSSSDLSDGSDLVKKSSTSGLIKNDGTIDTTSYSTFSGSYNDLTNRPTIPSASTTTPSADTSSGSYGSGTSYARSNHTHPKSSLYAEATHSHTKSQISDFPSIPTKTSDLTNDGADGTNVFVANNDSRLSDARTPTAHNHDDRYYTESEMDTALSGKQATLVSGTNIKTINNNSLLGSGNITIEGGGGGSYISDYYWDSSEKEIVLEYSNPVSVADIVTSWEQALSDEKVPSEKLVKEYIDNQIGTAIQYIQQ